MGWNDKGVEKTERNFDELCPKFKPRDGFLPYEMQLLTVGVNDDDAERSGLTLVSIVEMKSATLIL